MGRRHSGSFDDDHSAELARADARAPWFDVPARSDERRDTSSAAVHRRAALRVPFVFLHNGFDSARTWTGVVEALSLRDWHPRLLAWDRYGAGDWPWPEGASLAFPDELVAHGCEELRRQLDAAGVERCVLVGHCLGGAVATRFAALHGQRCAGLHLTATGLHSNPSLSERADWLLMPWDDLDDAARDHLLAMHGPDKAERLWGLIFARHRGYIFDPTYDLRPLLARLRCPVRYLLGERDLYFDRQHAEAGLQAVSREVPVSLERWPDVGHDAHRERPAGFAADLLKFAQDLPGYPHLGGTNG